MAMFSRCFAHLCLALLALGLLTGRGAADQTVPPLPVCQPWAGTASIYPSPAAAQDNTLFSRSGYPLDHGLTYGGLKSTDHGLTWQQFSNPGYGNVTLSPSYSVDHALATASRPYTQTHISTDGGASWRAVVFPHADPNAFALGDAQHLYLGYGQEIGMPQPMELWASSDGGQSWQRTYQGLEVRQIAVSPAFAQDRTLLITLGLYHYNGGMLKSTDAGVTWTEADAGITGGMGIVAPQFSPAYATDQTLFCVNDPLYEERIYKSTDAGASWLPLANPHIYPSSRPELLISPRYRQDQTVWYVSYYKAVVSRDGGQTWQVLPYLVWPLATAAYCQPTGECGVELFGLTWKEGDQTTSYMYRSYDYGQTWQCLEDPTPPGGPPTPTPAPPAEIPEPGTLLLLAGGTVALAGYLRTRPHRHKHCG